MEPPTLAKRREERVGGLGDAVGPQRADEKERGERRAESARVDGARGRPDAAAGAPVAPLAGVLEEPARQLAELVRQRGRERPRVAAPLLPEPRGRRELPRRLLVVVAAGREERDVAAREPALGDLDGERGAELRRRAALSRLQATAAASSPSWSVSACFIDASVLCKSVSLRRIFVTISTMKGVSTNAASSGMASKASR